VRLGVSLHHNKCIVCRTFDFLAVVLPLVAALINAAAARAQTETQKPDWLLILKVLPLLGVSAVHPILGKKTLYLGVSDSSLIWV